MVRRLPRAIFLVPALLVVHNVEEAATMGGFLGEGGDALQRQLPVDVPIPSMGEFAIVLVVVTALPFIALLVWKLSRTRFPLLEVLLGVQAVLLLNVASHVAQAVITRGYVPGLATSLAVNLPFSVYLLRRAYVERWVSTRFLVALAPIAVVVHGPVLMGLMWAAAALT